MAHALISHIGNAADIFMLPEKEVNLLLGPWSKYKGRISRKSLEDAAEEVEKLRTHGISFLGYTENGYPGMLAECEDAPIGLYIRSRTPADELFHSERRIAVVGTRDISPYGHEWCNRIVESLAYTPEKPTVVSGLALGTDICAHRAALSSGLPTIAVMATGPDTVYPYRHREFAEKIASTEGCALITDYPPGTAPLAIHFLRRNRIIAGLSDATLLIESRIKGGGMMTARLAFSYNRDVYALPGRVDDQRSQGCNLLIKEKVAEAIDSIEGLADSLGLHAKTHQSKASPHEIVRSIFGTRVSPDMVSEMSDILDTIINHRGITLDDLSVVAASSYARISHITGMLEMEGLISVDLLQRCSASTRIYR
jgi:DNA processing protein